MPRKAGLWARLTGRAPSIEATPPDPADEDSVVNPKDETVEVPAPDAPAADAGDDDGNQSKPKKKPAETETTATDDDENAADTPAPAPAATPAPVGTAHTSATEPAPGSHAMFTSLKAEFGAAFASQAVEDNLTMHEAIAARVEELTQANQLLITENAELKKREAAYMAGEDHAVSTSTDDPAKRAAEAHAAELEKKGVSKGQAAFAGYLSQRLPPNNK